MSDKTVLLGNVLDRLIANGYAPTSATNPGAKLSHRMTDDPAAVLTDSAERSILALTVTVRYKAIRSEILAVFAKHGVSKAPTRVSSDGSETFIARPSSTYNAVMSRASKPATGDHLPAVALDGREYPDNHTGRPVTPAIIRLSGVWPGGDLLTVARDALPQLKDENALFADIEGVLTAHEPKIEYVPPRRVLSAQEKAEQAEDEKLAAELAKRNDPEILDEVGRRLMRVNLGSFSTPWERAERVKHAESPANRIALYDAILAERAEEQERLARLARRAS